MSYPQKSVVRVAAKSKTRMNLDSKHITTLGFGQLCPVYSLECVPGDHVKVSPKFLAQVAPLYKPSFADIRIHLRSFFVPHRIAWGHFEDFISNNPTLYDGVHANSIISVPYICCSDVLNMLNDQDYHISQIRDDADGYVNTPYDVIYYSTLNSHYFKVKLNQKGRYWLKVFEMLGYNFPLASQTPQDHSSRFSALPLLEFLRIFLDWYTPSQYQQYNPINGIFNYFKNDTGTEQSGSFHLEWSNSNNLGVDLKTAFSNFMLCVENDYFTSAWELPNQPAPGQYGFNGSTSYSEPAIPSNYTNNVVNTPNGTRIESKITGNTAYPNSIVNGISAYALDMLFKFQRFVTRNNLAGTRAVERILARFGVRVPDERMRIAEYIGSTSTMLDIMQVVNQGGEVQDLGYLAGRAIASDGNPKPFEYDVKEHGTFFVLASIEVKSTFVDGYSRSLKHLTPFDFYTPEFDGKTPQAISCYEVFSRLYSGDAERQTEFHNFVQNSDGTERVLGYSPRYAEYKFGRDTLSGDFLRNRFHLSVSDFELMRRVAIDPTNVMTGYYFNTNTPLDVAKILYQNDREQFNRIFNVSKDTPDPFYFTFFFQVSAYRPMLPVNDQSELDGFKELEMDTNGTKMN